MLKNLKRRKQKKTDYRSRLGMLKSGKPRIVIRKSENSIRVQVVNYEEAGDKTVSEVVTKSLSKYGWKYHGGNLSSAYLTGLLAGLKAKKSGTNKAVVDIGLQNPKNTVLYAAALGAKHAGIEIPLGFSPTKERITGQHISNYASKLKSENIDKFSKIFSKYIKNNVDPEKITEVFDEVRKKITEEFGVKPAEFEETVDKKLEDSDKKVEKATEKIKK